MMPIYYGKDHKIVETLQNQQMKVHKTYNISYIVLLNMN